MFQYIAGAGIGVCIISWNLGVYESAKSILVDAAICGKLVDLAEDEKPVYRGPGKRMGDFLGWIYGGIGLEMAKKRFREGRFDHLIQRYSDENQPPDAGSAGGV